MFPALSRDPTLSHGLVLDASALTSASGLDSCTGHGEIPSLQRSLCFPSGVLVAVVPGSPAWTVEFHLPIAWGHTCSLVVEACFAGKGLCILPDPSCQGPVPPELRATVQPARDHPQSAAVSADILSFGKVWNIISKPQAPAQE